MKLVDEGVKTVTKDVAELSEAIVEDSKATYSAFSEATYSTIEQVLNSQFFLLFLLVISLST